MTDEETTEKLMRMKLTAMALSFRKLLAHAPGDQLTLSEQMAMMVDDEWAMRENRRLARLIRSAHLSVADACLENAWCDPARGLEKSLVRELGPLMVSILLAGRVASATTAELASMKVYQEVDALETMNIPPARFLVLPRLLANLFYMPILTMVGIIIGWFGGAIVCEYVGFIGVDSEQYFHSLTQFMTIRKVFDGLIKAEIFGFCIILIACNTGLRTKGGPREIGYAVTRSVVLSLITILILDYFITKALA